MNLFRRKLALVKGSTRKSEQSDWPFTVISKTMKKNLFDFSQSSPYSIFNIYRVNTSLAIGNCQRSQILLYTFVQVFFGKKRCLRVLGILNNRSLFRSFSLLLPLSFSACFTLFPFFASPGSFSLPRASSRRSSKSWRLDSENWSMKRDVWESKRE